MNPTPIPTTATLFRGTYFPLIDKDILILVVFITTISFFSFTKPVLDTILCDRILPIILEAYKHTINKIINHIFSKPNAVFPNKNTAILHQFIHNLYTNQWIFSL